MSYELSTLLPALLRSPRLHARWLNTFSFMEYVGFRKIVKSQPARSLNLATLRHAAEEARHAILLKRLALEHGGPDFESYEPSSLLCGKEAEAYFQALDQACESALATRFAGQALAKFTYLYVTWLVEERALGVYGDYRQALAALGREVPLQGLLNEEAKHLAQVRREIAAADPAFPARARALQRVEQSLYRVYLTALAGELSGTIHHAAET